MDFLEPPIPLFKIHYKGSSPETPLTTLDEQQQAGLIRSLQQALSILSQDRPWTVAELSEQLQPSTLNDQLLGDVNGERGSIRLSFANKGNTVELYSMRINGRVADNAFSEIRSIDLRVPSEVTSNFKGDVFLEDLGLMPNNLTYNPSPMSKGPNRYSFYVSQRPPLSNNQGFEYKIENNRVIVSVSIDVKTQQDMLMAPKNISLVSLLKRDLN